MTRALKATLLAFALGCASAPRSLRQLTAQELEEERLDPEVRAVLACIDHGPYPDHSPPALLRRDRATWDALKPLAMQRLEMAQVLDLRVDGPSGPVPLRVFRPIKVTELLPAIVYLHGGEYTAGSLDLYDSTLRALAQRSRAVLVAVGYRLAPEAPFPAALADVDVALRWAYDHAVELGADKSRLALAGDDAGATLALAEAVALGGAGNGGPVLRALALAYPLADARMQSASWREFGNKDYLLSAEGFGRALGFYLGATSAADPRVSPALLAPADLARLPPSLFLTAELAPARDDEELLAEKIRKAGGKAEVRRSAGLVHGFLLVAGAVEVAAEALNGMGNWLLEALAPARH